MMTLNYIAKLQNLKAIHNLYRLVPSRAIAELYRKITKFESNSQLDKYIVDDGIAELYRKITKFESNSQPNT